MYHSTGQISPIMQLDGLLRDGNMQDCMIIRGSVVNDDKTEKVFRPATPMPSMHWAYMLVDQYRDLLNISIKWIENEPMVTITKESHKESEDAFKHIMGFAKLHNLDVTWCKRQCDTCDGHISCLSGDSRI